MPVRCSERERRQPDFYGYSSSLTSVKEPQSVREALTSPKWVNDAMRTEIDSLHDNRVWELVELLEEQMGFQSENQC